MSSSHSSTGSTDSSKKIVKKSETDKRPTFRAGLLRDAFFKLQIGTGSSAYIRQVHEDLLCFHSPYFRKAILGRFQEIEDRVIVLEDTDPNLLATYMDWVYFGTLPDIEEAVESMTEDGFLEFPYENAILALYIFADRYDTPKLREDVVRSFYNVYVHWGPTKPPYFSLVITAFTTLPESSPLLHFLETLFAARYIPALDPESERKQRERLPHNFLLRMFLNSDTEAASHEERLKNISNFLEKNGEEDE
ncbi:hypothetical protein K402DRAFT_403204 [Aulographum hederae CBS 113979]|uniref:BTB domain-containing protein n=1 Tax=Aulographum hederae CBS 113979 TaxID=1176131 RepID=A0A6G1H470_9PEZI|nr:hypothetical protein K402DRAFT_403204 [Aulographum hederae CBS 113979]